ncbi:hypothetical protein Cni_G06917 [Canna indica]|uniref:Pentatricopeptide repeat-containing protein n=1 Tax=Canna indica TaxID=4628 RepID=A0AAQ3K090_9LILI|nr:hypothetical protein Cni_G06917 [Canna indica]
MLRLGRTCAFRPIFPSSAFASFSSSSSALSIEPNPSSLEGRPRDVLAHAIADLVNACQTGHWSPSLDAALSALARSHVLALTSQTLLHALSLLRRPSAAAPLLLWSREYLPLDPRAAAMAIHLLLRSRAIRPALDLLLSLPPSSLPDHSFNALLRRLAAAGHLRSAVRIFRLIPSPSVFSYNSLLAALLRRGRTVAASALFDKMVAAAVRPDVCTFNTLIRGFCLNSMVDEAFRLFNEMPRHGCAPDIVTYNTLLDGLCRAGKVPVAHNFLKGMQAKNANLAPNVVSYTTMIRGYCNKLLLSDALDLFHEMVAAGLKPNKITYNTLIQGCCEAGRMDLVKEILEQGADSGKSFIFKPDTCTFNILIAAHCNMGSFRDALKVFERMTEIRVKRDSATYTTMLRGLCENGEFGRAEELIDELLEKEVVRKRGSCVPLVAAYNPIFDYLCQNGKTEKARMVLQQLLDKQAKLDATAFKTVILGHCMEGKYKEGYKLLVSMVKRDLVPDSASYQTLIEGFLQKVKIGFAWEVLRKMLNSRHRPSTSIFHVVLAGLVKKNEYAKEAGELLVMMLERKIRPNIDLSTGVIASLLRNDLNDRAFKITGLLYDNGYHLKIENLLLSLCENQKFMEARELLLFGLDKSEKINGEVYGMVVSGLCSNGRASEAFRLFYQMNEKGSSSTSSKCLYALKHALEEDGKLKEAEFVSKQMNCANNRITNDDLSTTASHFALITRERAQGRKTKILEKPT